MSVLKELQERSESKCELCNATENLSVFEVPPTSDGSLEQSVLLCNTCLTQIEDESKIDVNHWRCLNDTMWSQVPAVQVMVWRMLHKLRAEGWPQNLLDMMYVDDETLQWAKAESNESEQNIVHKDVNGVVLQAGDNVVLIKDLKVKGSSMVAKQGTAVRRISLDPDNAEYIEGKVDGQTIVIITKFVKKI